MGIRYTVLSTFIYGRNFHKCLLDTQTYLIQNTWGREAWECKFLTGWQEWLLGTLKLVLLEWLSTLAVQHIHLGNFKHANVQTTSQINEIRISGRGRGGSSGHQYFSKLFGYLHGAVTSEICWYSTSYLFSPINSLFRSHIFHALKGTKVSKGIWEEHGYYLILSLELPLLQQLKTIVGPTCTRKQS